jgi:glucokinase
MVPEFLATVGLPVELACFDVAGPVIDGRAQVTNLPWVLDEPSLAQALGLRSVRLLNDLEAIARAVPLLRPDETHALNPGEPVAGGNLAVIAPGTGLGEAFLTWEGTRYRAHGSEGGHCDFAPTTPLEVGLLQYLQERYEHVSFERVCSGIGIPNLYRYLRDTGNAPESPELAARLAATADPNAVLAAAGLDPTSPDRLCRATIDLFVSILGAEASNLALKVLATGGVYLGGGIPAHVMPALDDGRFMGAFRRKGRFASLLERVPVHVITVRAAIIGAADCALEMARE